MADLVGPIEVENLRQLRRALKAAGDDLGDLKAAGKEAAEPVLETAHDKAPKLSGALDATLRSGAITSGAVIKAGFAAVPYAPIIHFGYPARNISPQPFLYDAIDERQRDIFKIYQARIDTIAKRVN